MCSKKYSKPWHQLSSSQYCFHPSPQGIFIKFIKQKKSLRLPVSRQYNIFRIRWIVRILKGERIDQEHKNIGLIKILFNHLNHFNSSNVYRKLKSFISQNNLQRPDLRNFFSQNKDNIGKKPGWIYFAQINFVMVRICVRTYFRV